MNHSGAESSTPQPEVYSRDEHPITHKDIDPDALKIMQRLIRNGFKAYIVGGGVRDVLLGKKPKDFDMATDATPRRIKALFSNSRIIGRRFKLVHVFFGGGKIIEVATFRDSSDPVDVAEGEENDVQQLAPDNRYGTEYTDALRRDVTINGLFYDSASGSIIDYVGGIRDLSDRVVRVIGDPQVRFAEDPVRMVRVVRHAARTGFSIDKQAWDSIAKMHQLLRNCPAMRVFEELKKDLQSGHFLKILRLLAQTQLLDVFLPDLLHDYPAIFAEGSPVTKILAEIDERFRIGKGPSVAVVLSAIALLSKPGMTSFLTPEGVGFASPEDLQEYLAGCFKSLAVPRRERERIDSILTGWLFLVLNQDETVRPSRIVDSDLKEDLILLLEILEAPASWISAVERQPHSRGGDDDSRYRGGRERGRRPRRRRSGRSGGPGRARDADPAL
jgi:poly(A) polymerase